MRTTNGAYRAVCAALVMVAAGVWLHAAAASAQNARWRANYFPNVTLTTQDGAKVRFYDDLIKGKIVAVNLIYTTCKYACPLETARLAQVQRLVGDSMGRDVFFYSITIDPDHDTPEVLKKYAEKFHAGPGWLFLTGTQADIDLISRKIGLYSEPDPASQDGHTPHLLVGNEVTGQWIRNSGVDDPRFLATTLTSWMTSWHAPAKAARSYADAPVLAVGPGEYRFKTECAACHTIGGGDRVGPDLKGVTTSRDPAWLARFIAEPDAMRRAGDKTARELSARYAPAVMPRLGLAPADVALLLQYIGSQSAAAQPEPAAAARGVGPAPGASIPAILDPYLRIQRALNVDAVDGIEEHAREIAIAARDLGAPADSIRTAATAIGGSDITADRAAFARLSDAVISYAKQHTATLGADVRVAYCPMLRKHWVQRGETIQNPYGGRRMPDCGRIVGEAGSAGDPTGSPPPPGSPGQPVGTQITSQAR
jgi:protein SCO1